MKKILLVLTGAIAAAGIYYVSRTPYPPVNEQVQGALGARRLAQGAKVCVNKIQNKSGKPLDMNGVDDDLVSQLSSAGFKASAAAAGSSDSACDGSVYGEIVALKGKDRMEAEVEFRLMINGDQTPFLSSIGKGKSLEPEKRAAPGASPVSGVVNGFIAPAKRGSDVEPTSVVARQAVNAAFADVAKQIERQQPSRSTRASAQ